MLYVHLFVGISGSEKHHGTPCRLHIGIDPDVSVAKPDEHHFGHQTELEDFGEAWFGDFIC